MSYPNREDRGNMSDFKTVGASLRELQTNPNAQREGAGTTPSNSQPGKQNLGNPFGGASKKG